MANLRDKGFPGTIKTPRIKTRTAKVVPGTAQGMYKTAIPEGTNEYWQSRPRTEVDQLIDDKAERYADAVNMALKRSNIPLEVTGGTYLYQPDYNWGKWTNTTYVASSPDRRLGFISKQHDFDPRQDNSYSAGIDIADSSDVYFDKDFKLPLGMSANIGFEDGTLYGNVDIPQKNYYINALANLLLNRGNR